MKTRKELRFCGYNFSHPKNITVKEAMRDSNSETIEELQEKASNEPLHLKLGHSGGMNYQVTYRSYEKGMEEGYLLIHDEGVIKTLKEQIEECKKTGDSFEKTIETEYTGYDNKRYDARAILEIEPCGDWQISIYDYYDPEKEEWIDTEERMNWEIEEINNEFFGMKQKQGNS